MRPAFRALASTILPEAGTLADTEWGALERIIADALAQRPAAIRRQLGLFIRALDVLPVARWGRPFHRLDATRRTAFLHAVERSPLLVVRRGFWGLRTLVLMGYYGRPVVHAAIGYQASLRGWLDHPAGTDAARQRLVEERRRTTGSVSDA
jgi:hypothetical protein